jgi:hypothetical protein
MRKQRHTNPEIDTSSVPKLFNIETQSFCVDNPINLHARGNTMSAVVEAPLELVKAIADMRFPAKTDARLQFLMDKNTNGQLSANEREELEAWVELSETISLDRAQALLLLGRTPL